MPTDQRKATLQLAADAYGRALSRIEAFEKGLVTLSVSDLPFEDHLRFDRRRHNVLVLGFRKKYREDKFEYIFSLARIESLLGRRKEAIARLDKTLIELANLSDVKALRATEIKLRNLLGVLYEDGGQELDALRQYKFILEYLDRDNEQSRLAIRRMGARRARRTGN